MAAAAALAAPAGPPQLPFPPQFGFPGAYAEEDEDEEENEDEMYEHERYGTAYWDEEDEENAYEEDEDGEEEMAAMYAQMGGYRRRPLPRDWAQPSQLSRAARPPRQKQPMQPLEPSLVMPDPALNPNMLELGTIELPIRVRGFPCVCCISLLSKPACDDVIVMSTQIAHKHRVTMCACRRRHPTLWQTCRSGLCPQAYITVGNSPSADTLPASPSTVSCPQIWWRCYPFLSWSTVVSRHQCGSAA